MRKKDALTSVEIEEIVKTGGKVNEFYERKNIEEKFRVSLFKNCFKKSFKSRIETKKKEGNVVNKHMKKDTINGIYEQNNGRDFVCEHECVTNSWMEKTLE